MSTEPRQATETLSRFADRVGCHFTSASRLRNGERLPSGKLLTTIVQAYRLDPREALAAYSAGAVEFGDFLRKHVFYRSDIDNRDPGRDRQPAA